MTATAHVWLMVARTVSRLRFTLGFVVVLWAVGLVTGTIHSGPSAALRHVVGFGLPALAKGHWWCPVSSALWAGGLPQYLEVTVGIVLLCGLAERCIGSVRTALAALATYVAGALGSLVVVAAGHLADDAWSRRLATLVVCTPSAAAFGASMAASAALPGVWRKRLRLTLIVTLAMLTFYGGAFQDLIRLCAGISGLALAPLVVRPDKRGSQPGPSIVEARLLLAVVVAASAVGSLVAPTPQPFDHPPLSILQYLLTAPHSSAMDVALACEDPTTSAFDCGQLRALWRLDGLGPAILSIIPALAIVVMAEGLRRGRRFAWWGAFTANVILAVLGTVLLPSKLADAGLRSVRESATIVLPLLQPIVIAGLLLVHRHKFDVRAPRGAYRRLTLAITSVLALSAVTYVLGSYLVRDQFDRPPSVTQILADLPLRYAPPDYLGELPISFLPQRGAAILLYGWTGVVFWAVALAGCLATFLRTQADTRPHGKSQARALLRRYGGDPTAHMITWPGHHYWFSDDRTAVVAYRVRSAVALTTGGPVGAKASMRTAAREFARYCASKGWTPCFYGITDDIRLQLDAEWNTLQVAEEARLSLPALQFRGKKFQDVRTAINKAKALSIEARRMRYREAPREFADQVLELSQDWLTEKPLPEMGFTLGSINELDDEDVWCLAAVSPDGTLHGVTSWLPVWRDGKAIGWTLDFMRRSPQAFPGVMEFLIASMATSAQAEGAEMLSLSGAPLARINRDGRRNSLQRLLDLVGRRLEPVYGFHSLLAFKAKFQPEYQPMFMAYPDAAALPRIASAITHAYLPHITPRQTLLLVRTMLAPDPRPRSACTNRETTPPTP